MKQHNILTVVQALNLAIVILVKADQSYVKEII